MTATGCGQRPGDYEDDALTSLLSHLNVSVSSSIWTRAESNFLNILNFRGIKKYARWLGYCLTLNTCPHPRRHPLRGYPARRAGRGGSPLCRAYSLLPAPRGLEEEKGRG
jgi:hypothetical protein